MSVYILSFKNILVLPWVKIINCHQVIWEIRAAALAGQTGMIIKVFLNTLAPSPHLNISNYWKRTWIGFLSCPMPPRARVRSQGSALASPICTAGSLIWFLGMRQSGDTQRWPVIIFVVRSLQAFFHLMKIIPFLLRLKRKPGTGNCIPLNPFHRGDRRWRRAADQFFLHYSPIHIVLLFPTPPMTLMSGLPNPGEVGTILKD